MYTTYNCRVWTDFNINKYFLWFFSSFFALEFINIQMAGRASLFENLFQYEYGSDLVSRSKGWENLQYVHLKEMTYLNRFHKKSIY